MYTFILNTMQLFIFLTLQFCSYLVTACSNMLDGLLSFLIAPELQTSCAHERGWNTCNLVVDLPDHGKPLLHLHVKDLETDHDFAMTSMKPFYINKDYSPTFLHELLLDQPDRSDTQHHRGDKTDSNDQLIHGLGRELSISCLVRCSRSDYGSIASLNHSCRSLVRSGALYKMRRLAGVVEYWVYYSCNLCEWEAFNPVRRQWMQLPKAGFNQCFMCSDKESLAVATELLVFGREIYSHVVYKYSVQTNSWSVGTMTNKARCLFGSASMGAIGIVAGGCDAFGHCINSAELYDSEAGTWTNLPNMHKPRKMCSGVFMDGKFYVLGGIGEGGSTELTCGEEYDLEKKTWREIPGMFPAQNDGARNRVSVESKSPPLLAVAKNELYAAYHAEQELRKYDKRRNSWATIGRLPENVSSMNGWGMAFRACGDKLVAIGGPTAAIGGIIEINAWEPNEGTPVQWELLGSKHSSNFVYNCAVMGC